MFCKKPLGANEVVESFPVGRRLAFDAAKGRLWVVCAKCQRWNLTPLEERWEAVEECERLFRETPMRMSTENIGIARHGEGLDLVRVGEPSRAEFAAWRYGDRFGRRRRRALGLFASGYLAGAVIAPAFSAVATVVLVPGCLALWRWYPYAKGRLPPDRGTVDRDPVERADIVGLSYRDVASTRLSPTSGDAGFGIEIGAGRRLALEMSLHEERERRALEGELWILEQAWREAEEIAAIADNLLLPSGTEAFLDRHGGDG